MASSSRNNTTTKRNKTTKSRLLLKILLSLSVLAVIGGSYWQAQLLKGTARIGSSLVPQWEAGLPKHSLNNILLQQSASPVKNNTVSNKENGSTRKEEKAVTNAEQANVSNVKEAPLQQENDAAASIVDISKLPLGFQSVLKRSRAAQDFCNTLPIQKDQQHHTLTVGNVTEHVADLPDFGIVQALLNYTSFTHNDTTHDWQCQVPPPTECNTTHFTVIFMGYNPDRLNALKRQVFSMTQPNSQWSTVVKEAILVWNGPRNLTETDNGQRLYKLSQERDNFRIFYPLLEGFPNDLMNRYHPRFNVTTAACMFYDDDGPFYSFDATHGGFELWKRNANAQVGAMARKLDLVKTRQQQQEAFSNIEPYDDHAFIQHCRLQGDQVRYNYFEFANYGARMVLPSGSFLHRNYLCFLWHPALEEVREFVRHHPVHPDDITVSTIVSHVAGRAPKVYSRRINPKQKEQVVVVVTKNETADTARRRRLQQQQQDYHKNDYPRRRLLWQDVSKDDWATMRSMAVNSLVSYFGGVNSGSLGWCHGTPQQEQVTNKGKTSAICKPEMANIGMLPWMTEDNKPKDTCP